jgi:hypothetical protein
MEVPSDEPWTYLGLAFRRAMRGEQGAGCLGTVRQEGSARPAEPFCVTGEATQADSAGVVPAPVPAVCELVPVHRPLEDDCQGTSARILLDRAGSIVSTEQRPGVRRAAMEYFVGIDVAKATLDVALEPSGEA